MRRVMVRSAKEPSMVCSEVAPSLSRRSRSWMHSSAGRTRGAHSQRRRFFTILKDSCSAKTVRRVIARQPHRLHPGIDNDGADEFKPAVLQRLRDFLGKRGLCKDFAAAPDGGTAHHI